VNGAAEFRANAAGRFTTGVILAAVWVVAALGIFLYMIPLAAEKSAEDAAIYTIGGIVFLCFYGLIVVLILFDGLRYLGAANEVESMKRGGAQYHHNTPVENTGAIHYDGVVPDSVNVSVDGVHYVMDTRTGELTPGELE
jgi:hypothetical protein